MLGVATQFNKPIAIYDYDKCVDVLMKRDGMSEQDAIEFMEYNVTAAWMGEATPAFLRVKNQGHWIWDDRSPSAFVSRLWSLRNLT